MKKLLFKLRALMLLLLMMVGVSSVWAETYSFTIQASDFNTTSYAANNGSHDITATCTTDASKTMTVACTSNQVMKNSSNMQWQKSNGYIYNTTDLGSIKSVTVNSSSGTFTTYYGTKEHPTSGTTVGNGYFTVKVGSATGTTSSIVVEFEKSTTPSTPPTAPTFSPAAGSVEKGTQITFSSETTGCTFRYTTDGTDPTATTGTVGSTYTVNSDVTLKVVAVKGGLASKTVSSASYTVTKHNATFYVNGTPITTQYAKGDAINVPSDLEDINGKKFVGWSESSIDGTTNTEPSLVTPAATMGTSDLTYYAVFANAEDGGTLYKLVSSLTDGKNYIFATRSTAGSGYALSSYVTTGTSVTIAESGTDKVISGAPANTIIWTAATGWSLTNKGVDSNNKLAINGSTFAINGTGSSNLSWTTNYGLNGQSGSGSTKYYVQCTNTGTFSKSSTSGSTTNRVYAYEESVGKIYSNYCTTVGAIKTLTGIEFGGALAKTVYTEEEEFDPTGITVLASYEGEDEKEDITSKVSLSYSTEPLAVGTTSVKVSASYKGFEINNDYAITVNAIPTYTIHANACAAANGSYTIQVGSGGTIDVPAEGATYQSRENVVVSLKSTATEGYKLHTTPFVVKDADNNLVSLSKNGEIYSFTMPAKEVSITAQFVQLFTISKATSVHGEITSIKDNEGNDITATSKGSKVWVTVTPDSHYTLSAISVKKADESDISVTVDQENANRASFSMPQSNVTVFATFVEDAKHNVTFSVNGAAREPIFVYEGDAIEFPSNVEIPNGYAFKGWTTSAINNSQNEAPEYITEATMGNEDMLYYAVFAQVNVGEDKSVDFNLNSITNISTSNAERTQSTDNIVFTFSSVSDANVNGTHYVQMAKASTLIQNVAFAGNIKSIKFDNFYYSSTRDASMLIEGKKGADGTYSTVQSCGSSYDGSEIDFGINAYDFLKISIGTERAVRFTKMTIIYSSLTYSYYCTTTTPIAIDPTTYFEIKSPTINVLDNDGQKNTYKQVVITNSTGTVIYTSSDETIATVDADGEVTAVKGGVVTITATIESVENQWNESSASYTLTFDKMVPTVTSREPFALYVGESIDVSDLFSSNSDGEKSYSLNSSDFGSLNETIYTVDGNPNTNNYNYVHLTIAETDIFKQKTTTSSTGSQRINVLPQVAQTISFVQANYTFAFNEEVADFTNALTGAKTTVTYTSDNENIATIDENGLVHIVSTANAGTVTISAKAANEKSTDGVYYKSSNTASFTIRIMYGAPIFSLVAGEYHSNQLLEISAPDAATIYYTTNDDDVTFDAENIVSNGTKYNGRVVLDNKGTTIVKAIAVYREDGNNYIAGAQTTATYSLVAPATPTISIENNALVNIGDQISISSEEGTTITYIVVDENAETVAEGTNVTSPVCVQMDKVGTFTVEASAIWNIENGYKSDDIEISFKVAGPASIPFAYNSNASDLPSCFTKNKLSNYSTENVKIGFKDQTSSLTLWYASNAATLSFDAMVNGGWADGIKFVVSTSENGSNWSILHTFTDSNEALTESATTYTFDLPVTARYIKWSYDTKVSGRNVGIGNIKVSKKTPTLAFAAPEYWVSAGATIVSPEVRNDQAEATITYSVTDGDAASVTDGGNVRVVEGKTGDVTITASVTPDKVFNAASASYVLHVVEPRPLVVTSAGWATFAPSQNVQLPSEGMDRSVRVYYYAGGKVGDTSIAAVDAYETLYADGDDTFADYVEAEFEYSDMPAATIARGTGILVKAEEGTYYFPVNTTVEPTELTGNQLVGVAEDTPYDEDRSGAYLFSNGSNGIGFYEWHRGTLTAGKCYLQLTPAQAAGEVRFIGLPEDDELSTSIELVFDENGTEDSYNLFGQKVDTRNYKGIIVKGGVKSVVK